MLSQINRNSGLLSGFGNEDYLQDFLMGREKVKAPLVNISENENQFKLELGLAGYKKEDLSIRLSHSNLIISGSKKKNSDDIKAASRAESYEHSSFYKTFSIPESIAISQISAKHEDGLLTIILPKDKKVMKNASKIEIN